MIARALAVLAGTLGALLSPSPWSPAVCAALAGLACVWLLRGRLALALGLAAAAWAGHAVLVQRHALVREDERVLVDATVVSLPVRASGETTFDVRAVRSRAPGLPALLLRARWRNAPPGSPRAGEHWQLAVQLRAPRAQSNPGAVDALRILWRDHVQGRAEVLDSPLNRRTGPSTSVLLDMRARVADRILASVPDPAAAALLAALAVGDTGDVGAEEWRVYNATGITHLIAISGMHVTLFAALVMAVLRRVWRLLPMIARRIRRESFVAVAGLACAWIYALLAGDSVPTQRTVLMLAAGLLWRQLARTSSPASALGMAGMAALALDPFAVLAAGFWLSFGAVAVILWREGSRVRPPMGVRGALRLQLAITAALVPATVANFASVPLAGLLVNPFAIPLFGYALVPLVLGTALSAWAGLPESVTDALLWLAGTIAAPAVATLTRVAQWPAASWGSDPPIAWYVFALIGCLLCILPLPGRVRLLALAAAIPLLSPPDRPPRGAWRAWRLDAGDAPLALVVTRAHALLFGTGDRHGTGGARIARIVVPAARQLGVSRLDLLIAGRLDRDVAAGVGAVQALLPADRLAAMVDQEGRLPPAIHDCATLGRWTWDDVPFEVLPSTGSARGCDLRIGRAEVSLRLTSKRARDEPAWTAERIDGGRSLDRRAFPSPIGVWHAAGGASD